MTPVWEHRIDPDLNDADGAYQRITDRDRDRQHAHDQEDLEQARRQAGDLDRAGGPIQAVETQVLIDGEPVTVTEAARQHPGQTARDARARAAARARHDAREIRDDVWDQMRHDEPDPQITP